MNLINKEDKIFVAGHKGMVGQAIYKSLSEKGYKNLVTAERKKLDLTNEKSVNQFFYENQPDIVIIAAAKVGGIIANNTYPYEFLIENLKIQNNLISCSFDKNVNRLLFLGSSCIYPRDSKQPINEKALLTGSLEKTNESYAIAKIAGIKLCNALRKQYGFDAISLMPTNLYGPGDNYNLENSHVIPALLRKFHEAKIKKSSYVSCWGSGTPYREFLHVNDLANACIYLLENYNVKSNLIKELEIDDIGYLNVGTGSDISIKDLTGIVSEVVGFTGQIKWDRSKPDGTPRKRLDVTRLQKLGWSPSIDLKNGLEETYKEFKMLYNLNQIRK